MDVMARDTSRRAASAAVRCSSAGSTGAKTKSRSEAVRAAQHHATEDADLYVRTSVKRRQRNRHRDPASTCPLKQGS